MIEYKEGIENIAADDLAGFFEGWKNKPSNEKFLHALSSCQYVILAFDGKKIVGFINAISDRTLSAYIPLLEVLPEYRNKGIGKNLVQKMFEKLEDHYMVDICCDEKVTGFYSKLGMTKVSGMIKRNYDKI